MRSSVTAWSLYAHTNMNEDRFDVVWTSMWEKPIRFISVDTKEMEYLYKEGKNNQYKVDVYPRPLNEEAWGSNQIPLH